MTLTIIFLLLAFTAKACMDTLAHHYSISVFNRLPFISCPDWHRFWNPANGHNLKWKNADKTQGERFFGSTTFLVWITDGWHLMQAAFLFCFTLALLVYSGPIWLGFLLVAGGKCWFEVCYRWLLMRSFWAPILRARAWAQDKVWGKNL